MLRDIFERCCDFNSKKNTLLKAVDFYKSGQGAAVVKKLFNFMLSNNSLASTALMSLFDFYFRYGTDEMLLDDIEEIDNWGLTIRDGQKVPVIIDAGYSEDIY